MKIVMRDGRVFQGTALQIVKAMQDIAFGVECVFHAIPDAVPL